MARRSQGPAKLVVDDAAEHLRNLELKDRLPRYEPNSVPKVKRDFTPAEKAAAKTLCDPRRLGGAPT